MSDHTVVVERLVIETGRKRGAEGGKGTMRARERMSKGGVEIRGRRI